MAGQNDGALALADELLENPGKVLEDVWDAIKNDQLIKSKDGKETPKGINIRFTNLPRKTLIRNIRSDDINRFLNYLRDDLELGPKTILNHWIALSSFWTWVERDLGLPHIIRGKVNRPRPRRRWWLAHCHSHRHSHHHTDLHALTADSRSPHPYLSLPISSN